MAGAYHKTFSVVDYCLFGLTLIASMSVGLFFSCHKKGKKNESANDVLMGGGNMPILPTALSLMCSFISGITLLAIPAEIYQRGVLFWVSRIVGSTVGLILARFFVLPIFFRFRPTSSNEYFEYRFRSRPLRWVAATLHNIYMVFFMAVVLYAPSIALNGVTGVPTWVFFVSVGLVCVIYTAYGGLKAVVWADSLQAVIMLIGLISLFIKGTMDSGGFAETFGTAAEYGRFDDLGNISLDPMQYMTLWISMVGGSAFWLFMLTFNQIALQRYLSLPDIKSANKVIALNIPSYWIMMTIADLLGVVMFSYFRNCDPLTARQIHTKDQLVIIFALEVFDGIPGMPGVFLACLLSGTLSTVSSGINSLAAVTWEDFMKHSLGPKTSNARQAKYIKLISLGYGILAIILAFMAEPLGGIIKAIMSIIGATAGPLVGIFILGMAVPFANRNGAFVGLITSFLITGFISMGNAYLKPYADYSLPVFTTNCTVNEICYDSMGNYSLGLQPSVGPTVYQNCTPEVPDYRIYRTDPHSQLTGWQQIFGISDMIFATIGVVIVLVVGIPVSLLWKHAESTGFPKYDAAPTEDDIEDEKGHQKSGNRSTKEAEVVLLRKTDKNNFS